MATAVQSPSDWPAVIAAGIDARFTEAGYVNADGDRDYGPLVEKLTDLVLTARVSVEQEKGGTGGKPKKAIDRARFVREMFPDLPERDAWQNEPDPGLAEAVYSGIDRKVWDLLKSDASAPVQQMVGIREPGLLVCRARIGANGVWHAYVTDNLACIKADFNAPLAKKVEKANLAMAENMKMAIGRLPQHVRTFDSAYKNANKSALNAGENVMREAIAAAKDEHDGGE